MEDRGWEIEEKGIPTNVNVEGQEETLCRTIELIAAVDFIASSIEQ